MINSTAYKGTESLFHLFFVCFNSSSVKKKKKKNVQTIRTKDKTLYFYFTAFPSVVR